MRTQLPKTIRFKGGYVPPNTVMQVIDLGGYDSTSAPYRLSSAQLARPIADGGSFYMRAIGTTKASGSSDLGSPFTLAQVQESNRGIHEIAYGKPSGTNLKYTIGGVDTGIQAAYVSSQIQSWDAGDHFVLEMWNRTSGKMKFRLWINGVTSEGYQNGTYNRAEYPVFSPGGTYTAGQACKWLTLSADDDPWILVATTSGVAGSEPTRVLVEGATVTSGAVTFRVTKDERIVASPVGTITGLSIGGELASNVRTFRCLWSKVWFYGAAKSEAIGRKQIVGFGDSRVATNGAAKATMSFIRTPAECFAMQDPCDPAIVCYAHSGAQWAYQATTLRNSDIYRNKDPNALIAIVQMNANNLIAGQSASSITTDAQDLHTACNQVPNMKVITCQDLPYGAFAGWTSGQEANRTIVNANLAGTGANPINCTRQYRMPYMPEMTDGGSPEKLPVGIDSGDGLHPSDPLGRQMNAGPPGTTSHTNNHGWRRAIEANGVSVTS